MIVRVVLALVVMIFSTPLVAQANKVVTASEWRGVLGDEATDDDSLLSLSTRYSSESTDLLNAGERAAGLRKSLISLVLTKHVHDRKERAGEGVERQAVESVNGLQRALTEVGISPSLMKQSAANLATVLGDKPSQMAIKARPTPRPATAAERRAMIAVIKSRLIDPTSPIFGRADIVGNEACFTVNAKNRLGGYTGNKEAVLRFDPKTKTWSGGGTIDYPHGVCLDAAR